MPDSDATIVYDDAYLDYDFGPGHPFSPTRQRMLTSLLDALGCAPDAVSPPAATRSDVLSVHDEPFVERVEAASSGRAPDDARRYGLATGDVPVFEGMDAATRQLVGGTLHAARLIMDGDTRRALTLGGGLHHAHADRASGFCVYNDLGVALQALRDAGWQVVYLDVDVHHGDGVQALFYDTPDVFTVSLHESGQFLFPGTGGIDETGRGAGAGTALNVPLQPHTEAESYLDVLDRVVPPVLEQARPDLLVVQCGADAHAKDPLAHLLLTTQAYEAIFRRLRDWTDAHTEGRLLCTLGGGYHLDATTRVWALLYHVMQDRDLPETLPADWRDAWADPVDGALTPTLHDDPDTLDLPERPPVADQNRQASTGALERLAHHWH